MLGLKNEVWWCREAEGEMDLIGQQNHTMKPDKLLYVCALEPQRAVCWKTFLTTW